VTAGGVLHNGDRLCSVISKAAGDDPGGSAGPFDTFLGLEVPLPWAPNVIDSPRLPADVRRLIGEAQDSGAVDKFVGILPGAEYRVAGHVRALLMRRPSSRPFARYERREYLLPEGEVPAFVAALADRNPSGFERFLEGEPDTRDLLVCTHGSRDACCGKFGYPVYNLLTRRFAGPQLRVWRASHIGEHRFSPTLMDFPEGRYWGHLEPWAAEAIARQDGEAAAVSGFCRGWAGLEGRFEQLAERELLARHGWEWTRYRREARTLSEGEGGAEVVVEYETLGGEGGAYTATVERSGAVMTLSDTGTDPLEEEPQYRVVRLAAGLAGGAHGPA